MNDDHPDQQNRLAHQAGTDTYTTTFSDTTDPPSAVVAEAIEAVTGQDLHDLDPLYDVINPSALDALFQPTVTGGHRGDGTVSFTYQGYEITVRSYGVIEIQASANAE